MYVMYAPSTLILSHEIVFIHCKVNTSRGGLIDNQALIDGLRSGWECSIGRPTADRKKVKGSTRVQIQGVHTNSQQFAIVSISSQIRPQ